jgi:plastocyanin
MPDHNRLLSIALVALAFAAVACSTDTADTVTSVRGTDDGCEIADPELPAGRIEFEFTNEAGDVNELYVLRENGDVVNEVENVTTGTQRSLTLDLSAGDYRVVCKPGQIGDGITSTFTVVGEGGTEVADADRTIVFEAVDFTYNELDLSDVVVGETIRFEMTNRGGQDHEFEVLDPLGEGIGEVGATKPGEVGGATITFTEPGTYTYVCVLIDPATDKEHVELGMTGSFPVVAG